MKINDRSLAEYLAFEYPFQVDADPEGGYVVIFPDLPGCITEIDTLDELPVMAEDARREWLMAAYEQGDIMIPLPSYPEEYSGKFNVRLSQSLHRQLAEAANTEGVSLNSYVAGLLARGDAQVRIERQLFMMEKRSNERLMQIEARLHDLHESLRYQSTGVPKASARRARFITAVDEYDDLVAA
jgi:antitoxin HicB